MQASEFATIQSFLEKISPKDAPVQKALGVNERHAELFWAALSAITEEKGLAIPNFLKLAGRLIKFPSTYITGLHKKGLIGHGDGRGQWSITNKAIKKMEALLNGEVVAAEETPATRESRRARIVVSTKLPRRIAKKTVGDLIGKLEERAAELDQEIKRLTAERNEIKLKMKSILDVFS